MSLSIIYSRTTIGVDAPLVIVETHLSKGLPRFSIVGLPETAVKESKDRVRSAILNNHFEFPDHRITVNLAPADIPKVGSQFDLAIALGILAASGQIPKTLLHDYEFVGELALSGKLRAVKGILPILLAIKNTKRQLILPKQNANEATLIKNITALPARHLLEVCAHLTKKRNLNAFPTLSY